MDTSAYLTNLGWRGSGHSLHPTGRGLARPLLVAQKSDTFGVGKKKHDFTDQWWSRAFDASLKGLTVERTTAGAAATLHEVVNVRQKDETGGLQMLVKTGGVGGTNRWLGGVGGGLYDYFTRGEGLSGTIGTEEEVVCEEERTVGLKRKRENERHLSEAQPDDGEEKMKKKKKKKKEDEKRQRRKDQENPKLSGPMEESKVVQTTEVLVVRKDSKDERREERRRRRQKKRAAKEDSVFRENDLKADLHVSPKESEKRKRKKKQKRQRDR